MTRNKKEREKQRRRKKNDPKPVLVFFFQFREFVYLKWLEPNADHMKNKRQHIEEKKKKKT